MGRRNKVYQMINDNIQSPDVRLQVIGYISHILKEKSILEKKAVRSKKKRGHRSKRLDRFIKETVQ